MNNSSQVNLEQEQAVNSQENLSWIQRNNLRISSAIFVGGLAVAAAVSPLDKIEHEVLHAAPWMIGGIGATEAMWVGGLAMMAAGAGKHFKNPIKLIKNFKEIMYSVSETKLFKRGFQLNAIGALGTAAVVEASTIAYLPKSTWVGATTGVAVDTFTTVTSRAPLYLSSRKAKNEIKNSKPNVRSVTENDIERLAELDLLLFDKAYGTEKPELNEVKNMLMKRYKNNPKGMKLIELNGEIEGFASFFRTNIAIEDFKSWENSTSNGTLDNSVDSKGKYAYVSNLTIKHQAVELGGMDMLLASLYAEAVKDGVDYAYFVSRMPHFKSWLGEKQSTKYLAQEYLESKDDDNNRIDPQIRMYENYGYKPKRLVENAFQDDASCNYGVLFRAEVPPNNKLKNIKIARLLLSKLLDTASKHPSLLKKLI